MGIVFVKPDKFSVVNESSTRFKVHVAQITKRQVSEVSQTALDIDGAKAASSVMKADTPAEKLVGLAGAFKSSNKKASSSQFVREDSTFAVIGSEKSLVFNLPSGKDAEVFISITEDVARSQEENATVLCSNYSPPAGVILIIDKEMNLNLKFKENM